MGQMPKPPMDFEPLLDTIIGCERFKTLATAVKYDIFTLCEEPKTVEEISKKLGTDPKMTRRLLNGLAVMELLVKEGNRYKNSPLASTFLVKSSPFYQGDYIKLEDTGYSAWPNWDQTLKEGIKPLQKPWYEKSAKEMERVTDPTFTLAMSNFAMRGGVHRVVDVVKDLEEFKKAEKLLDLGGGTGIYSIALAQSNPNLKVVLFDIPPILEITKNFITKYGMNERFEVRGGNFMQDDLGDGYDIIFASHSFYAYPKEMLSSLLKKACNALNDGGLIISNHFFLNEDGTGHKITVFWDIWFSLLSYPISTFTECEFTELIKESGFSILKTKDVSIPTYPSTVIVGKKEV